MLSYLSKHMTVNTDEVFLMFFKCLLIKTKIELEKKNICWGQYSCSTFALHTVNVGFNSQHPM